MSRSTERRAWDADVKAAALALGWRAAGGGFIYRTNDDYVFELSAPLPGQDCEQRGSLTAKPLALDPIFWEIVGSPDLLHKRVAFRVNGAFTVPLLQVGEVSFTHEWTPAAVVERLHEQYSLVEPSLLTLTDFEPLIEAHCPPSNGHRLVTCVTWSIAVGRIDAASQLVRDFIDSDLSGGFRFSGGSFEELALDHLGLGHERGLHVESIDGHLRRVFPGARWSTEQRLRMDLEKMDGVSRFAVALWRMPDLADRRTPDDRWDSDTYVQCAGGPDRFVVEVRQADSDGFEQLVLGHPEQDPGRTVDVRRGEFTSTVFENEVLSRDEALDILLRYLENDAVPPHLAGRRLNLPGPDKQI